MATLHPTTITVRRHGLTQHDGMYVAEASTIGDPSRVYDDACDVGYTVVPINPHHMYIVAQVATGYGQDREVQSWTYAPIPGSPDTAIPLRVYND